MTSIGKGALLFFGGVLFGTAGIKALSSRDAKKAYTHCTAAALRAKKSVMETVTKVQENGLSDDGKVCLSTARCLGCCGMAPLMCINGEMYGNLKEKDVDDIIAKLD